MRGTGEVLVVSCYELGHQPLAAATLLAFLERAGFRPAAVDLAVEGFDGLASAVARVTPGFAAVSVPMHTALHLGVRAVREIRAAVPSCHVHLFGLYATLNAQHLLGAGVDSVSGGEVEEAVTRLVEALEAGRRTDGVPGIGVADRPAAPRLARLDFPVPSRAALPDPTRYAHLVLEGEERPAAAIEASRGCLHRCRHCPIPPIYGGRFFVVPRDVVLRDVDALVAAGVRHVTFADPDFFNGPKHALGIVRAVHERHPDLTFDATIKVEHLLRHARHLPELARSGCLFVVSAVESLSDVVLGRLDKGHVRADADTALDLVRGAGLTLRPTFVAFTPWTALEDYVDLLDWIEDRDLVDAVDPVQLSIRLLVPPGSLLADLPELRPHRVGLEPGRFAWSWRHPDPRMDRLHERARAIVARAARGSESPRETFAMLRRAAEDAGARVAARPRLPPPPRPIAPRLSEPWFC